MIPVFKTILGIQERPSDRTILGIVAMVCVTVIIVTCLVRGN